MTYRELAQSYASESGAQLTIKSMITSDSVVFPAFLTDIGQNFKSSWQTENVFGRNDPIATFQNTTRTVTLSFNVPAGSIGEAKSNLTKMSTLIKFLYPAYYNNLSLDSGEAGAAGSLAVKNNYILSKSPLVTIEFANLVQAQDGGGLLGYMDGIDFKPTLSLGMFVEDKMFYPKNFEINISLNVLHQEDVGVQHTGDWLNDNKKFPF